MIRTLKATALSLFLLGFVAGCSSTSESSDDSDVLSAIEEAESSGGDAAADDEFSEEEAFAEESGESQEQQAQSQEPEVADDFQDFEEQPAEQQAQGGVVEEELEPLDEDTAFQEESIAEEISEPAPPVVQTPLGETVEVTNIAFRANDNGGTVVIETSGSAEYVTRTNPDTNQFVVEISNAHLPERLKRPYIMKDFDGAFAAINAYQNPGSSTVRVVVQQRAAGEPVVQQEGGAILVIPSGMVVAEKPATPAPMAKAAPNTDSESYDTLSADRDEKILGARTLNEFLLGNNKFYGRPINIQVKDGDVRDVINLIADHSGANLVLSEDVKGTVTLKLRETPWDQALVIVMRAKGLGYVRQGNVLRISTLDNLQAEAEAAKRILESQKDLIPLKVKVIPVSYAKVEDLVKQVEPFLTPNRGKAVSDNRTSSLIITDVDERIEKISRLVKELDVEPAQVMIEGKIVEAGEIFQRQIGINWGLSGSPVTISKGGGAYGAPVDLRANLAINPLSPKVLSTAQFNLNIGTLDFLGNLDATLGLAQSDNLVKIISSPRIVAMNKEKANISQSTEAISVSTVINQGVSTKKVERSPVTLDLAVTPQITSKGSVVMDVEVTRQFVGAIQDDETLARPINSRTAKTKVLVDNAQTVVIGGIYQNDESNGEVGVPFLKDIPVLGWLFKSKNQERNKNELLIFLTPRIVNLKDQKIEVNH